MAQISRIIGPLAGLWLTAAVSAHIMMEPSDHNENMYVAAAVMAKSHYIYKDFSYAQMPFLPFFYSFLYEATGTDRLLFAARVLTCALWAVAAYALLGVARVVSGSRPISWCAFFLFATNTFVLRASTECSNYVSSMACFNVALLLFVIGIRSQHCRPLLLATGGLFAALAVGLKLYYVAVLPPLFVLALLYPRSVGPRERIFAGVLPLCVGFLAGITPALVIMCRDPKIFLFNNLLFYRITTLAYLEHTIPQYATGLTLGSKVHVLLRDAFERPSVLLIFVSIAFSGSVVWARGRGRGKGLVSQAPLALGVSTTLLAAVLVAYMTPLWPQYFAFPVPFAILTFAALHGQLRGGDRRANLRLSWILVGLCFLENGPNLIRRLPALTRPAQFVPMGFHRTALAVQRLVRQSSDTGPVATLTPIYPLEAGLPIYHELSTGIFLYWIGDRLTEMERRRYVATAPSVIDRMLEERPPRAILVGRYRQEEVPLILYARRHGYQRFDKRVDADLANMVLYVRPGDPDAGGGSRSRGKKASN